ncbi:ABC transporter substrate-binding protein [Nocardioides jishulii]|uniref:ABC transporter substrate-binding protein n=1 Tax=Nocardioides jishulii TaxID=2575440 RepID=A0A4U2YP67_9ACTN|nr:ABC transporter substrate-binding protein [Nocardioides jishulii]QCX27648.1 ABC transporter substrate-binding protein [Nocardioides jishulii]TKI62455.1 ABC transporter substrate-binding protein [Nocardioides jishulii]
MPRSRQRLRPAGAALCLLLVAAGCASDDGAGATEVPTELRLAVGGESEEGYDPTLGWGRYGSPLFQSTLLTRNADLSIGTDLATDYSVSEDGLVWSVDIRDDAEFSDGEPVTAEDVAYTFTTAAKEGGLTDVTSLKSAEVVDEDTVELTLVKPQSTFVNRLVSLGIVPEHAHGKDYAQKPVGSGPFTLVDWAKGEQLVVARNDNYYGEKSPFERVVFVFTDEDASLAAARTGDVHVAGLPAALATQEISNMRLEAITSIDNRGMHFVTVPDEGRKSPAGLPIGNDVTADKAIRQAVNYAVDRQALVDGVLEGFGSPATGPVDNSPWYNPDSAIEDADVDRAKKLLADAGWTDSDNDGVVEKEGRDATFTLLYPAGDSLRQGLALSVVDQVKPAGIKITTEGVSWDEIYKRLHTDSVLFGWGSHDPYEMYSLYKSDLAGSDLLNAGYYSNKVVDGHLDAALAATDPEEANEHWKAAQIDADGNGFSAPADAAWAWLVNLEHTYYVNDCLDLGETHIEPHGHGWPITASIGEWTWTC